MIAEVVLRCFAVISFEQLHEGSYFFFLSFLFFFFCSLLAFKFYVGCTGFIEFAVVGVIIGVT